jgi:NADH:ubiquinone oxidoreductase subunit K
MVGLNAYLTLSAVLFALGIVCLVTRRNAVAVLMGVELMLNAANVNFVAFARFSGSQIDGQMFAIFSIVLAAAEVAVALALVLNLYRNIGTIDIDEADTLRG